MAKKRVSIRRRVKAPLALVFERITDHERMADWPGITSCELVVEGEPRNGLGAVRRIKAGGLTLDERVVVFEPPLRYDYQIIKGLPVKHLGSVRLSELGAEEVEIEWNIELASPIPLLARGVAFALGRGLPKALGYFAKKTEAAARAN